MKKIVLASAAMGGAALVAFGASGTFAAFSDRVESQGSVATAGTLFLTNGPTGSSGTEAELNDMAPGDSATYAFYVENQGSVDGKLTGQFVVLKDEDNYCYPVEARNGSVDASCGSADQTGELDDVAMVNASYGAVDSQDDCTVDDTLDNPVTGYTIRGLANADPSKPVLVEGGAGFCAVVTVTIPGDAGNSIQSDRAVFGITYTIAQA